MATPSLRWTLTLPEETADCTSIDSEGFPNAAALQPGCVVASVIAANTVNSSSHALSFMGVLVMKFSDLQVAFTGFTDKSGRTVVFIISCFTRVVVYGYRHVQ